MAKAKKKKLKKKLKSKKLLRKVAPKKKRKVVSKKPKTKPKKKTQKKKMGVKAPTSIPLPPPAPTSVMLQAGDVAPDFKLVSDAGAEISLAGFRGKKVVLFFYPKDDTPGCTLEACAFRDGLSEVQAKGAVVLGVSADSVDSHQNFKQKFSLNFPLLSDANKEVVQKYGVWKEKSMYGNTFMGIERTTFIIDEEGKIAKIFSKVSVDGHYYEVLATL